MKIEFFDDQGQHEYVLDGRDAPSITRVLGAEGLQTFEFCDEADRHRGSYVHAIASLVARDWRGSTVEEIVRNSRWEPSSTREDLVGYGYGCALYLLESGFRPVLFEKPVGSVRLGVAGTLDQWGPMPSGINRLTEYKSGAAYPAAHIQSSLYSYCLEESEGLKTDERVVVELRRNATYKAHPPRKNGGVDLAVGMAVCTVYKWRVNNRMF